MIISDDKKEELLRRFFQGESASDLAAEYNISRAIIYKWIKQNGGLVKMDRNTYNSVANNLQLAESEKQIEENKMLKKQLREIRSELRYISRHLYELERTLDTLID